MSEQIESEFDEGKTQAAAALAELNDLVSCAIDDIDRIVRSDFSDEAIGTALSKIHDRLQAAFDLNA